MGRNAAEVEMSNPASRYWRDQLEDYREAVA